jgi:ATP-dependent DNA helicase RecQ
MASRLPLTRAAVGQLSGVGEKKAEDLGPQFAQRIREFVNDHPEITTIGIERSVATAPKRSSDTTLATIKLFQKGVSPYEIAKERGITENTVANHLEEGIRNGEITDISRLVPAQYIDRIRKAFQATGSAFLKPALAYLNDVGISYDHLKFVRALDERSN